MLHPEIARIRSFDVVPSLPEPLKPLLEIANNLWWTWHPDAVDLFMRLHRPLWHSTNHNPIRLLGECPQDALDAAARDDGYVSSVRRVYESMNRHKTRPGWLRTRDVKLPEKFCIAYYCAEFGLTESLPVYSGGLGCLAGDHLKSASELGLPLVAIGLLYRNGYFQQYLNHDGWQQEFNPELDFSNLPVQPVLDSEGKEIRVSVQMPGSTVHIRVWKVNVGRIPLFLLDTNLMENEPAMRQITSQLYGGDMDLRIKQEIVLGIGGTRALAAMNIEPDVCHMNEGHSAFLALERIRILIEKHNLSFDDARQAAAAGHVFTTHTPVPAGIDRFSPEMMQRYFRDYVHSLRLDMEGLLALGRENVYSSQEHFSMAVLAIRTADAYNGVSALHGHISRSMWRNIWPGVPESEIPIRHVTNGVHARSWLSADMVTMLDRYLGERWRADPADQSVWALIDEVPNEELWRVHERRKQRLIVWARRRLKLQLEARGAHADEILAAANALNPSALTIGFARRFATYKRGNLMLRDPARFLRMLENVERPIQFILAGKAHPRDNGGKDLIRALVDFAAKNPAARRIVFIENYDINVARYLVQGCDVWLNTPRRGMEASGTSGMKAALNGVLNCSILDGWWDEAYHNDLGWAIGRGESYANVELQDDLESRSLYDILESQILPLYYTRDDHGVPIQWITRMKRCIAALAPVFNTNRMVQDYCDKFYIPALLRARSMQANGLEGAKNLAAQKQKLRSNWGHVRVVDVQAQTASPLNVHREMPIVATVHLAGLAPDEVRVETYAGKLDNDNRIVRGTRSPMKHVQRNDDGNHRFEGRLVMHTSGKHGFAVRITPGGPLFESITEPGLIKWDQPDAVSSPAAAI